MDRAGSAGQGSVEYLGVVLVVAAMLAVAAAVGVRLIPAPAAGDAGMELVARRMAAAQVLGRRGGVVVDRAVPAIDRLVRASSRLWWDGSLALGAGFASAARDDLRSFITDPIGTLRDLGGATSGVLTDPVGFVGDEAAAAVAYARMLRALPSDEAYRRFMRDLGAATEQVAIGRGRALARKRVLRALRTRIETTAAGAGK